MIDRMTLLGQCHEIIYKIIELDDLRGGANRKKWLDTAERLNMASFEVLDIERRWLLVELQAERDMIERHMRDTGNPWGVPGYEWHEALQAFKHANAPLPKGFGPIYFGETIEDAEAKKRAAEELRERGEPEAAAMLESRI